MLDWLKEYRLVLLAIWLVMSIVSFCAMGIDKRKAKKNAWRIPEARLFLFALLLGGVGGTVGMQVFHHKTKHWYFAIGFPVIAVLQCAFLLWVFFG